jgi:hypothetical protein
LARVGPSPLAPWRLAMGWSEVAARSHARRLEHAGWVERQRMLRGQGSLFLATRRGVRMTGAAVSAAAVPAPTWWSHLSACAWAAAWLTTRGWRILGCREVLADDSWSGRIRWHDQKGVHTAHHRPDLAVVFDAGVAAIEVELTQKSRARLEAILSLHARWYASGRTGGVIYICADADPLERVRSVAAEVGLDTSPVVGSGSTC